MNLKNKMTMSHFKVIRPGINTTFQDLGRKNLYHFGIPFSGAMDNSCLLYTSPSPRDRTRSRMPSSA